MTIANPNDRHRPSPGDDFRAHAPVSGDLQADPELREGPAGVGRIAVYAAAILVVLGAVFYGLNSSPTTTATSPSTAKTAESGGSASNPTPPNVRDVTPNRDAATTTGAAPAQPMAPQSKPTGTEVDRSKGGASQ